MVRFSRIGNLYHFAASQLSTKANKKWIPQNVLLYDISIFFTAVPLFCIKIVDNHGDRNGQHHQSEMRSEVCDMTVTLYVRVLWQSVTSIILLKYYRGKMIPSELYKEIESAKSKVRTLL